MNLAAALYAAQRDRYAAENKLEHLLTALFPSWEKWDFVAPNGLEVWMAVDAARPAAVLHQHGFRSVTLHGHRAARLLSRGPV